MSNSPLEVLEYGEQIAKRAQWEALEFTVLGDIEYRVEDRIKKHSEDVQLKQSTLDETYNRRTGVERTNESVKDCGPGPTHARGRVHARAQVFLALCLRLVDAITNYERGDNPGSTIITV